MPDDAYDILHSEFPTAVAETPEQDDTASLLFDEPDWGSINRKKWETLARMARKSVLRPNIEDRPAGATVAPWDFKTGDFGKVFKVPTPTEELDRAEPAFKQKLTAYDRAFYGRAVDDAQAKLPLYLLAKQAAKEFGEKGVAPATRDKIEEIPEEQRQEFLEFVSELTPRQKRTAAQKLGTTATRELRSAAFAIEGVPDVLQRAISYPQRQILGDDFGTEQFESRTKGRIWAQQVEGVMAGKDVIKPEQRTGLGALLTEAERGMQFTAQQASIVGGTVAASAAGPWGGTAYLSARIVPQYYDQYVGEGYDPDVALGASLITGVPEALLENIQVNKLVPDNVLSKLRSGVATDVKKFTKDFIAKATKTYSEELSVEFIQNVHASAVKRIAAELSDKDQLTFAEEAKSLLEQMQQAAYAFVPMMAPGHAVGFATGAMGTMAAATEQTAQQQINTAHTELLKQRLNFSKKQAEIRRVIAPDKVTAGTVPVEGPRIFTPVGAYELATGSPEVAGEIAKRVNPSRKLMQDLGVDEKSSKEERAELAERLRNLPELESYLLERGEIQAQEAPVAEETEAQVEAPVEEAPPAVEEAVAPAEAEAVAPPVEEQPAIEPVAEAPVEPTEADLHRIITPEGYETRKTKLLDNLDRLHAGLPVDMLADLVVMGGYHFEGGVRKFTAWSKKMVTELGDRVKPHLRAIWREMEPARKQFVEIEKATGKLKPGEVKGAILENFRWYAGETIPQTGKQLLRVAFAHEARGAKKGYRAGTLDRSATLEQQLEYAREKLPKNEYTKVANVIERAAKARTPAEVRRIHAAIQRMANNIEKATRIADLKKAMKEVKKGVRPEFKVKIAALMDSFTTRTPRAKTLARYNSLERAAELDELGQIPQKMIDKAKYILAKSEATNVKDMTLEEIKGLTDGIHSLVHQSRAKNRMLASRKHRTAKENLADSVAEINKVGGTKYADKVERRKLQNVLLKFATWDQYNHQQKIYTVAPDGGATHEILVKSLKDADSKSTEIAFEAQDFLESVLNEEGISPEEIETWSSAVGYGVDTTSTLGRAWMKSMQAIGLRPKETNLIEIDLPTATTEGGAKAGSIKLTRAEIAELIANTIDPSTREQLLRNKAKGITLKRITHGKATKLMIDDINLFHTDQRFEQERAVASALVSYVSNKDGKLWNEWNQAWLNEHGVELETADVYWSRTRDWEAKDVEPSVALRNFQEDTYEDFDIFKRRKGSIEPIVIGDIFAHFFSHAGKIGAYTAKAAVVKDALRLVGSQDFKRAIDANVKFSDDFLNEVHKYIKDYMGLEKSDSSTSDSGVKKFVRRIHRAILGLKMHIVLFQTTSLVNATNEMSVFDLWSLTALRIPDATINGQMKQWSPKMRARNEGSAYQMMTPGAVTNGLRSRLGLKEHWLNNAAMGPIHWADMKVIRRIWAGITVEGTKKGLEGDALMEYVARRTEEVVDLTQPTWDPTTISTIQREAKKSIWKKLHTAMFSSQRGKNTNMAGRAVVEYGRSEKTIADKRKLLRKAAVPTIIQASILSFMTTGTTAAIQTAWQTLFGITPPDDKEGWKSKTAWGALDRLFGNWLFFGGILSRMIKAMRFGPWAAARGGQQDVVSGAISDGLETIGHIANAISESAGDEYYEGGPHIYEPKAGHSVKKATKTFAEAAGKVTGVPVGGVIKMIDPYLKSE